MNSASLFRLTVAAAVLLIVTGFGRASAQEPDSLEERVRRLYDSAEYEQALSIIGNIEAPAAYQYRALCLLALGRQEDAEAALKTLVAIAPEFTISAEEMPPRFVTLLSQTRRQVLPIVLRRLFTEARERYHAKAYDHAVPQFEKVISLSSEADVRDVDGISDLRLLAEGFVDLAKAPQAATPQVTAAAPAPPPPSPAVRATTTPPVAIRQEIPHWPAEAGPITSVMTGAVRVQIDSNGSVTAATMVKRIKPSYDARVIAATRFWEYEPATVNGLPVSSESLVEIHVNPGR